MRDTAGGMALEKPRPPPAMTATQKTDLIRIEQVQ
jgi:hypothetical protein